MTEVWTQARYQEHLKAQEGKGLAYKAQPAQPQAKPHKYHAEPTVIDGIRFDSKAEGRYYKHLKALQEIGTITGFLRQVPFHLPGKTRLVIDFMIFWPDDLPTFVDVKGFETDPFKIKIRQVREFYPWADIRIIKNKDF